MATATEQLIHKMSIMELENRYAKALDNRQWQELEILFTDHVEYNYGGMETGSGRDNLVAMIRSHLDNCGPTQHLFSNFLTVITEDGQAAETVFYGRVMHAGRGQQRQQTFDLWCEYRDKLIYQVDHWRICHRQQVFVNAVGDMTVLGQKK